MFAGEWQHSFASAGQFFDNSRVAWRTVVALLAVHSGLLMYSAYVHSPTLNEPGHLVAGLSHWKFGRFELYRVNPPLVRMVAALPVMAVGYEEDWSGFYEGPGARPVFGMGEDFVAANGPRTFFLTTIGRWACMPFSWLGAVVCYLWARDLYSRPAGLLACFIWCFEPNILAHASLITPDAHAAALGVAACYTFWRWLKKPTWAQAALTGVVLGLAELAKTTLILFYPLWPLLWLAYRWPYRAQMTAKKWLNEAAMLALRILIGLYVVNLSYGFEGSFHPLGEYHFVSDLFTGKAHKAEKTGASPQSKTNNPHSANRFQDTLLANLPTPFPKNYLLGIDIQQKDFEHYGRLSYLAGVWSNTGWWYYYLYAGAIKVPMGLLLLGGVGIYRATVANTVGRTNPSSAIAGPRDKLILLTPAIVVFCVISLKTGINEHFRYALPAFPFAFVWTGVIAGKTCWQSRKAVNNPKEHGPLMLRRSEHVHLAFDSAQLILLLLSWLATSSLWLYPHSLSYINEIVGGPHNGSKHLLGSCVNWEQDTRYAAAIAGTAIDRHQTIAYFLTDSQHTKDLLSICVLNPYDLAKRGESLPHGFILIGCNELLDSRICQWLDKQQLKMSIFRPSTYSIRHTISIGTR